MPNLALEAQSFITDQQTILEQLPVAVLIIDKKGNIQYANQEAEAIFNPDRLKYTHITKRLEHFKQTDLRHAIDCLNTETPFNVLLNIRQKDDIYQLIMKKTLFDNKDYYLLTLCPHTINSCQTNDSSKFTTTLTCQLPSQSSLLKKNFKELKQFSRLSAMREISSSLADKLNQPLTSILSYTQAMQRLYQNDASSKEINDAMKRVVINAENAGKIIRKIRSQLKVNTLNYEMACINDLIQDSIHLTELDNPTSYIKLVTEYDPTDTSIAIDKIQFKQVIFNLLNNAIDALLDASVLTPVIRIKTTRDESQYKITITDNGPGLADEIQNKLFEPFTSTKKNGIGIGLSMCQHIIGLHNGNISIRSEKQDSTIVTILLPIRTDISL